jgi:hypothetical protein
VPNISKPSTTPLPNQKLLKQSTHKVLLNLFVLRDGTSFLNPMIRMPCCRHFGSSFTCERSGTLEYRLERRD